MGFENPTDQKQVINELKNKLEKEGMKVFIDESKLDNPEAVSRVIGAFEEIKNAYRITISGADNEILVDIERSQEEIVKKEAE